MHWKGFLVISVIAIVTMAVVYRVGFLSNLVIGPSQKA